jgi:hypothetical protein
MPSERLYDRPRRQGRVDGGCAPSSTHAAANIIASSLTFDQTFPPARRTPCSPKSSGRSPSPFQAPPCPSNRRSLPSRSLPTTDRRTNRTSSNRPEDADRNGRASSTSPSSARSASTTLTPAAKATSATHGPGSSSCAMWAVDMPVVRKADAGLAAGFGSLGGRRLSEHSAGHLQDVRCGQDQPGSHPCPSYVLVARFRRS